MECTVFDLLEKNRTARGDHPALIDGDDVVSYAALCDRVDVVASYLKRVGLRRGDRVAVHLNKSVPEVVAMFAVWRLGGVMVNVSAQLTGAQLDYVLRDCGVSVLITDARHAVVFARLPTPEALVAVLIEGACPPGVDPGLYTSSTTLTHATPPLPPPVGIDCDLAALLYTSGSTGMPKGVMLTHRNLLTGARSVTRYLGNHAGDRLLSLLSFSFDYGLNQLLCMVLVGGTVVLQRVVMPAEIERALVRHHITGFAAVPPVFIPLVQHLGALSPAPRFPALRYLTNSGGKIPPNVLTVMPEVFPGTALFLMYGLTEAFRSTFLSPEKFGRKMGSIGQAIPNAEVFVITADGLADVGQHGELVHRGSLISRGYWGKPEATAEKIRPCPQLRHLIGEEAVCYSGDLVYRDDEGDLWFVGRADSMLKTSGYRVSPTEVEDVVSKSGLVGHVVAFGREDDLQGQLIEVAVTSLSIDLEPVDKETLRDALLAYCKRTMPAYMVPRRVHTWDGDMPRTGSGKLDRPTIIREALGR